MKCNGVSVKCHGIFIKLLLKSLIVLLNYSYPFDISHVHDICVFLKSH